MGGRAGDDGGRAGEAGDERDLVEPDEKALDRVLQATRVEVNAVKAERPPATMAGRFALVLLHARDRWATRSRPRRASSWRRKGGWRSSGR